MMERSKQQVEFESLLVNLIEGGISEPDHRRLGQLIESDNGLRCQYLNYCQMHALLRSEHGLLTALTPPGDQHEPGTAERGERRSFNTRAIFGWVAAACLFLVATGITGYLLNRERLPFRGAETATLCGVVGARFVYGINGEAVPTEGTRLRQGLYELLSGLVEIEYDSGAVLVLRAPATFELVDPTCVRLVDGQVAAHVPESAVGFRIDAPGATVIDLGTDFAIQAVKEKESEVHVFQGEVLVDLHGDKGKLAEKLRLVTGEAARVDFLTGMPSGIDLNKQQFLRSLRDGTSSYADTVLSMEPAVYYRMEPLGDGTELVDSTSNRANAKIHLGRGNMPVWTSGKIGAAFNLGGPAQQTFASAQEYPQTEGDMLSVSAWVYARSRPRWASVAKNWAGGDKHHGQFHFGLYQDSGELEAHIIDGNGKEIVVQDNLPLPLNTWHHVAFVADGAMLRLYRNGVEVDSKPYQDIHADKRIKALGIGTKLNLMGTEPEELDFNMWDGRLDELAIFNHALSKADIKRLIELPDSEE
jgi:hypothetical protein